jgi:hypothetical protein
MIMHVFLGVTVAPFYRIEYAIMSFRGGGSSNVVSMVQPEELYGMLKGRRLLARSFIVDIGPRRSLTSA